MAARVLIVDDDSRFREIARAPLQARGHVVVAEAVNGGEALAAVERASVQREEAAREAALPGAARTPQG